MDDEKCINFNVRLSVGIIYPKQPAPYGSHHFELRQGEKCVKAGMITPLGPRVNPNISSEEVINDKNFTVLTRERTNVMVEQAWSIEKPVLAKMTCWDGKGFSQDQGLNIPWSETGLPEAVVILEWRTADWES